MPAESDDTPTRARPSVRLKIQSGYAFNVPVLGETIRHFEERLNAAGGHGLDVRLYDAGKLVPTLQIFDAVAAGKIDAGFAFPAYWMGKIPAATVFAAVPFGPEAPELLAWIHHGGGLEIWRELYAGNGTFSHPGKSTNQQCLIFLLFETADIQDPGPVKTCPSHFRCFPIGSSKSFSNRIMNDLKTARRNSG